MLFYNEFAYHRHRQSLHVSFKLGEPKYTPITGALNELKTQTGKMKGSFMVVGAAGVEPKPRLLTFWLVQNAPHCSIMKLLLFKTVFCLLFFMEAYLFHILFHLSFEASLEEQVLVNTRRGTTKFTPT